MALPSVFIDGHVGTTGLRIDAMLASRADLTLRRIADADRKNAAARRELLNAADVVILCLPDDAARDAVAMIERPAVRVIDASTAHRVAEGWDYGLPEISPEQRRRIAASTRVANPGCYPTSVILGLRPLIEDGLLRPDAPIVVHALSGYTGGGRSMIERWEDPSTQLLGLPFEAPYALDRVHKHVPEMTRHAGLMKAPLFIPAVGPFPTGMRVEIPLHVDLLGRGASARAVWESWQRRYREQTFVRVGAFAETVDGDERRWDPRVCDGTNRLELHVVGNPAGHVTLIGLLDNLGKGAAGAAVQNLNLMLGRPETDGLRG